MTYDVIDLNQYKLVTCLSKLSSHDLACNFPVLTSTAEPFGHTGGFNGGTVAVPSPKIQSDAKVNAWGLASPMKSYLVFEVEY